MLKTSFCEANTQKFASVGAFVSNPFKRGRRSFSNRPHDKRNGVAVQADAALNSFGCINESLQ